MKSTRLFNQVRTIISLTPKVAVSPASSFLLDLNSYFEPNPQQVVYSKNREIDALIKSHDLDSAQKLFDEMPIRDVVTYNMLISGCNKYGNSRQSLDLYYEMVSYGIKESASTFSSVLSICSSAGWYSKGIQLHCRAVSLGFQSNLYVGSSLVDLYMRMGYDLKALRLFEGLPQRNLAAWNLILRGFCELGRLDELFRLYVNMKFDAVEPNGLSLCYLIRGCSDERFVNEGQQLHCNVIKLGWVDSNIFVANALVDFYSSCGRITDARKSFEAIREEDVISWNSIVSVYTHYGLISDALNFFAGMQIWGKRPSIRSFVRFLNLSSESGNIYFGKQIHSQVLKRGFDYGSVYVQSALIDMYGKCKNIESSVAVFKTIPKRNLECCNSLMTSLLCCGIIEDAIEMFGLIVDEGLGLDEVTVSSALKALSASNFVNIDNCRLLHCFAIKLGFEYDMAVSCSLMDTYSRYGHVEVSRQIFEKLPAPNIFCFTSIINGYARNGMGIECLKLLEAMVQKGLNPDKVLFLCVLTGCNHSGLVHEGQLVFNSMKSVYGVTPEHQHYSCMVDLFGRAGLLEEAVELMQQIPGKGDCAMWSSLLRSCRIHRNEVVGRQVAKNILELEPEDFAIYVQASNFYSEIGEFEFSMQIREIAVARKVARDIGNSLIEVNSCG